jgi:hypothetical protein
MMIIKHSNGTIESVYDDREEAEKDTKKKAGVEEVKIEKPKKNETDGDK